MRSGIYVITNLDNGKVYVGSSSDIRERCNEHKRLLKKGRHHSAHLQSAWAMYGKESFTFEVIELSKQLQEREQYWIDAFDSANRKYGYNSCPAAGSTLGLKLNLSEEERTRRRLFMTGDNNPRRFNPPTGEKHPRYGYRKPSCKYGHAREGRNVNSGGSCRTCANKYSREYQYAKRHKLAA